MRNLLAKWPAFAAAAVFSVASAQAFSQTVGKTPAQIGARLESAQRSHLMSPGLTERFVLTERARRLIIINSAVANARIEEGTVAVVTARAPGKASIAALDDKGGLIQTFHIDVVQAGVEQTGSVQASPGPSFDHTPSRAELLALMGRRFSLKDASSDGVAAIVRIGAALPASVAMPVTGATRPPFGWSQFCSFYPEECRVPSLEPASARLDAKRWRQLQAINDAVNHRIEPVSDIDHHGLPEHWDYPMDGKGDCEDYALLKRRLLIEAGWPRQSLRMTVVKDRRGDGHAVLTVVTDRGDFILDNQNRQILPWQAAQYPLVKRQSGENPNSWEALGDTDAPLVAAAR